MSKKLNVQCYNCNTVYELEPEMVGETVECAVCGSVFIIPDLNPDNEDDILETNNTEQESSEESSNPEEAPSTNSTKISTNSTKLSTETIKLNMSRGHGMIPLVDDKFGIDKAHQPKHFEKNEDVLKNFEKLQAKSAKKAPSSTTQKWWHLGSKKK